MKIYANWRYGLMSLFLLRIAAKFTSLQNFNIQKKQRKPYPNILK